MTESYGDWLKSQRTARSLTQAELGRRIGTDRTYINKIERGKVDFPLLETRRKIADVLGDDYEPHPATHAVNEDALPYDAVTATVLQKTAHWTPAMKLLLWRYVDAINEALDEQSQ